MSRRMPTLLLLALAAAAHAQHTSTLPHRVWLLDGIPPEATLASLRAAGVDALAVPIGEADVGSAATSFTVRPPVDTARLSGWPVAGIVWLSGSGESKGDATSFLAQLTPAQRLLPGSPSLVLAARRFWPGLPDFAREVARRSGRSVELAITAQAAAANLPEGGWDGVELVLVAFANPPGAGFDTTNLHDDLAALDVADERRAGYRAAFVVAPRSSPPVAGPVSLGSIARGGVSEYRPGERGDTFILRRPFDWGGSRLETGARIEVEVVDTARYHRDLGLALRPVRNGLRGWDTVGLPGPEPTLGMSLEALLDYLGGGVPFPMPRVTVEAAGSAGVRVSVDNPSPHGSALSTSGNWVELRFTGTELRDVQLGEFAGVAHGRLEGGGIKGTVARDATAIRLFVTCFAPRSRVSGGTVAFLSRPRSMSARWGVRLADGSDEIGPLEPVVLTRP
ncbi:MAG: hypothetical protein AB1625_09745 [Acidobacteriota bacterium]